MLKEGGWPAATMTAAPCCRCAGCTAQRSLCGCMGGVLACLQHGHCVMWQAQEVTQLGHGCVWHREMRWHGTADPKAPAWWLGALTGSCGPGLLLVVLVVLVLGGVACVTPVFELIKPYHDKE